MKTRKCTHCPAPPLGGGSRGRHVPCVVCRGNAFAARKPRAQDTRRKILAGAAVLDEAEGKEEYKAALFKLLGKFLTRPEDRALFGQPSPYSKTLRRPLILMGLRRIGFPRRIVALVGGVPCPSPADNFTEDGRHQYLHSLDIQRLPSESRRMPHRHP